MLALLYPDEAVRNAVVADPQTAPIPDVHKAAFPFSERFVTASWEMGDADFQPLRDLGVTDAHIVNWAGLASGQGFAIMQADASGIELEPMIEQTLVVGKSRDDYHSAPDGLLAPALDQEVVEAVRGDASAFGQDLESPEYQAAAAVVMQRYGFVPNFIKAVSLDPRFYDRHLLALELLERPQTVGFSARQHAMVRALVSQIDRSSYGQVTTRALVAKHGEPELWEALSRYPDVDLDPVDRVILDFADKVTRHAYKVTQKDVEGFRAVGLTDEVYVDVLCTTSIQVLMDRMSNCLNVEPDEQPTLTPWQLGS